MVFDDPLDDGSYFAVPGHPHKPSDTQDSAFTPQVLYLAEGPEPGQFQFAERRPRKSAFNIYPRWMAEAVHAV